MVKENKRIAIYIRVSTLDQAREGYSLEAQEKTLRKWCDDRKYEVFELYAILKDEIHSFLDEWDIIPTIPDGDPEDVE